MASLNDFMAQKPRPLPVIIASDRSGSMQVDGKIDALNIAIRELIRSLKDDDTSVDLQVALFSFDYNLCYYNIYSRIVKTFRDQTV